MMKRMLCMLAASILLLSLTGCAAKAKANSSYTGTVSTISADSITLATDDGEVTIQITANTQMTMGGFGSFGQMGSMPEGDFTMPEGEERPEPAQKPEGDFEKPEGDFTRPEGDFTMPEGDFTMPEGEMPSFEGGQMPEGMTRPDGESFGGGRGGFGGMDISSIPVGTSVTVTTGADKTAATISISMDFGNFGGQRPNFQN